MARGGIELTPLLSPQQRPYAVKTAGIPLRSRYDFHTLSFSYSYINPIPSSHPFASAALSTALSQAEAEVDSPPLVGVECAARETEVFLPRRRYGRPFREGRLRVKIREGDGEWRYDEEVRFFFLPSFLHSSPLLTLSLPSILFPPLSQLQTLYLLHTDLTPGCIHTLSITVTGPSDRRPLRKWYEPPAWALEGVETVWLHLALVCGTGLVFGLWLIWKYLLSGLFESGYREGEALMGEL